MNLYDITLNKEFQIITCLKIDGSWSCFQIPPKISIEIDQDDDSFGFVVLELIKSGAGRVTCKKCDKTYNSKELELFALGAGNSPLRPNIDISRLRNLFCRRKRNPSLIGGEGYKCPAGHEMIMQITWRT